MRQVLLVTLVFSMLPTFAFGQPQVVDSPWVKVGNRWERQIGGIGGQADLTLKRVGGKLTFSVRFPCFPNSEKPEHLSWQEGGTMALGKRCNGRHIGTSDFASFLPLFYPLPVEAYQ